MRFMQYENFLLANNIHTSFAPLFADTYIEKLQDGRRDFREVILSYIKRLISICSSRHYDIIWIEKECLPWLPKFVELSLLSSRVPFVLDYDDAVFHYYDLHPRKIIRNWLSEKHPELMRRAALVIAGNQYLADCAHKAGAKNVVVIPTVIDLDRYRIRTKIRSENMGVPCIGWIGQRSSAHFLRNLSPVLESISRRGTAKFIAVGIDSRALHLPMDSVPWSEESEVECVQRFDIGIMPLKDGPFERGKCGYKLIQYMACGLPVVASPVGANRVIVEHGVNGFIAETSSEWEEALQLLIADPALRQKMGEIGRIKVEQEYCVQVTGQQLAELLIRTAH